jgi:hypothetical protein
VPALENPLWDIAVEHDVDEVITPFAIDVEKR